MSEQAEAMRLADWFERGNYNHEDATKAAAELRRVHLVNQELLKALKLASTMLATGMPEYDTTDVKEVVDDAIAKAEGRA